jgi:D-alanine-D-alanine ligase
MTDKSDTTLDFSDRGATSISAGMGRAIGGGAQEVGVVFGGPSPEHDVSVLTGLQAARALSKTPGVGRVRCLYWSRSAEWFEVPVDCEASRFVAAVPPGAKPLRLVLGTSPGFYARKGKISSREELLEIDVVLVCCHGGPGEDGTLQGVLDLSAIPYTGPSVAGAAIGMDKLAFGALVATAFLPSLPRVPLYLGSPQPDFPGPYIVKPRYGGSSIGIEVVDTFETATGRLHANVHLRRGAVLEPYRPDLYDLQIAVRAWPGPQVELSGIERPLRSDRGAEILDYADKYVGGEGMVSAPRELPAVISAELERDLRRAAVELTSLASVRGIARIDFLSDGDGFYVNEINTIPGSLARYLWITPRLSFETLLAEMLNEAIARPATQLSVSGADGSVLRSAGSIAAKLA